MHRAITIGGLLLSVGVLAGLLTVAFGLLSAFANMMADGAGDDGNEGCICIAVGLALLAGSIAGLVLS